MPAVALRPKMTEERVVQALVRAANEFSLYRGPYDLASRFWLNGRGGGRGGSSFDLDAECGYEASPDAWHYQGLYARGGIAARVNDIWPDECWAAQPELFETEDKRITKFERAWAKIEEEVLPWHYLHRVDRLSGIGRFGILLLGLDDGRDLSEPAPNIDPNTGESLEITEPVRLQYLRVFDETLVQVEATEGDVRSPRFMCPTLYNLQVAYPGEDSTGVVNNLNSTFAKVHWTRVLHFADNCHSNEILGVPRMRPVLNLLHDTRKVQGGSAEMFIKGGFPGYAFESFPNDLGINEADLPAIRDEIFNYQKGFQRFLTSEGGKWSSLAVQVANPKDHLEQYIGLICATIGVPISIFMGRETGHLAGTQDTGNWKDRLRGRQVNILEPKLVRPFAGRLQALGALPRVPRYLISWRDLRALSDTDRADVALKQVQALTQYVTGRVGEVMPKRLLWTLVLGMSEGQADAIEAELKRDPLPPEPAPTGMKVPGGGGRKGNPPRKPAGRPKGRVEGKSKPVASR